MYFSPLGDDGESAEHNPWREIVDSFTFIFLIILFMALRIERSLLEVLALTSRSPKEKILSLEIWGQLLTDLSWLALKVSSLGFLLVLSQRLFEEVYRKLGGESLKIVFSLCTWIALLLMSPLLIPSFGSFLGSELAEFWKKWLGVSL